jgi:hypothetical protein
MKLAPIALAVLLTHFSANAQKQFAPLEAWQSAVLAGNEAALAKMYRANATPRVVGTGDIPLKDEIAFWSGAKSKGIENYRSRLLEFTTLKGSGHTWVVVRMSFMSGGQPMFLVERQEWSKEADGWKIVAARRPGPFQQEIARVLPQPAKPNTDLYADPGEGEAELKAALAKAAKEHKRVIVVFGGNWCYDCHVLDTTFRSKEFAPLVNANFVVVHINIGEDVKDNTDIAARLGVVIDKGVPSLGVLEGDGTVVFAQKNGEFENTVKIGPAEVKEFLEKWKPRRS